MLQTCTDALLARHALRKALGPGDARQLQRYLALERTIDTLGQPDGAHAAAADLSDQAVGPHQIAVPGNCLVGQPRPVRHELDLILRSVLGQHLAELRNQTGMLLAESCKPPFELIDFQVHCLVEQSAQGLQIDRIQVHGLGVLMV